MAKTDLKSMTLEEMQDFFATIGEPKFRAKQVFQWLHDKRVKSFDEMTNLSKQLREKLSQETKISNLKIVDKLQSQKDGTTKYLFALDNDNVIESVLCVIHTEMQFVFHHRPDAEWAVHSVHQHLMDLNTIFLQEKFFLRYI